MCVGYLEFWRRVFCELGLEMDTLFESTLREQDTKKAQKNTRQQSKKGKVVRGKGLTVKFSQSHRDQMNDAKSDKMYSARIAFTSTKKQANEPLTPGAQNPEGTPKDQQRCPYHHHLYCTALGHNSCSSNDCLMKQQKKTLDKRKQILGIIKSLRIQDKLLIIQEIGNFKLCMLILQTYIEGISILLSAW